MKVGIDTRLAMKSKAGIGHAIQNLVLQFQSKELNVHPIAPKEAGHLNTPKRLLWDQLQAPKIAKSMKVDIFHQPGLSTPVFYRIPTVVSLYHHLPQSLQKKKEFSLGLLGNQYHYKWIPYSVKYAHHCITSSEYSKKSIVEHLGIAPDKVSVVPLAPSGSFISLDQKTKRESKNRLKRSYPELREYLLFIGTTVPYKNFKLLVQILKELKKVKPMLKLVICGGETNFTSEIMHSFVSEGLETSFLYTGHVPDEILHDLLANAKILLMPSLYEGFGMPPLEAMQCGIPVISSNAACLPETVGDGGILLSPDKSGPWVQSILDILASKNLQDDLVARGYAHVKKFSWEKAAEQTYAVYEHVYRQL